jgi:hypothetical protein
MQICKMQTWTKLQTLGEKRGKVWRRTAKVRYIIKITKPRLAKNKTNLWSYTTTLLGRVIIVRKWITISSCCCRSIFTNKPSFYSIRNRTLKKERTLPQFPLHMHQYNPILEQQLNMKQLEHLQGTCGEDL